MMQHKIGRGRLYGTSGDDDPISDRAAAKFEGFFDIGHTLLEIQERQLGYEQNKHAMDYAMMIHGVGHSLVYTAIGYSSKHWFWLTSSSG
jgi:hypothetical protein